MSEIGLLGKVAVVTGAGKGIGAAVATELAANGAQVAALDNDEETLAGTVEAITAKGDKATAYRLDVRDSAAVERVVSRIEDELGPIGILANVAGVLRLGAIVELTDEDWSAVFDVNTHGVFYMCRAVARRMLARRYGAIVVVGSNAGGVPRKHMAAYAASKAAATSFVKCLGLELGRSGVRCNVVSPGSTDTAMLRGMWSTEDGARATIQGTPEDFRVGIPLGKLAVAEDVAAAVLFLASERSSHITMHNLYVDGGAALGA